MRIWSWLKFKSTSQVLVPYFLLTLFSDAYAGGPDLQTQVKAAKTACLAGEVQKGITLLAELYVATNDPTYIYNQARCYQQNDHHEKALSRFHEYRRKSPSLSVRDEADLQQRIDESEAQIARRAKLQPAAPPPEATNGSEPNPIPTVDAPSAPAQDAPAKSGKGLRIAGVITTSVGLACIGAGIAFNLLHRQKEKEVWSPSRSSDLDRYRTYSLIGYGVGATALTVGITLYLVGRASDSSSERSGSTITFLPSLLPTEASLSFRRTF